jgi:DNA-binding PucR family transcriptional regulator
VRIKGKTAKEVVRDKALAWGASASRQVFYFFDGLHRKGVIVQLSGLILVVLAFAFYTWGGSSDLGANVFTEAIGIYISVSLIQYVLAKREEAVLAPEHRAAMLDALTAAQYAADLLASAMTSVLTPEEASELVNCSPKDRIDHLAEWLTRIEESTPVPLCCSCDDISQQAPTWKQVGEKGTALVRQYTNLYLLRHVGRGYPEITAAIHNIERTELLRALSGERLFFGSREVRRDIYREYAKAIEDCAATISQRASIHGIDTSEPNENYVIFHLYALASNVLEHMALDKELAERANNSSQSSASE